MTTKAAENLDAWATKDPRRPVTDDGTPVPIPPDWELVPPGDAALTRRLKAAGPTVTVREKRGRRAFSQGVWVPPGQADAIREALATERADPAYAKKIAAGRARREAAQERYVEDFEGAVRAFLAFHERYRQLEGRLAAAIARHATPVGSGTVARTQRIPVERRAEAATIAWLRHQTTAYDDMVIPRVKGMRRQVRRQLAERSRGVLEGYRRGEPGAVEGILERALGR